VSLYQGIPSRKGKQSISRRASWLPRKEMEVKKDFSSRIHM
jgi:hypothetical protein